MFCDVVMSVKTAAPRGVVGAVEVRRVRAAEVVGLVPVADVHARLAVRQLRQRELRAVGAQRRVERRLDLRPGGAVVERPPDAFLERADVEHVRVVRVDGDLVHAAARSCAEQRERRAGLAIDAACRAAVRGRAADRAAGRGDTANGAVEADEQVAGLVEHHRAHGPVVEEVAAGNERPRIAAVGRLVDAETGLGVTRRVRLAGAHVDRVARRVGRVDEQSSRSRSRAAHRP